MFYISFVGKDVLLKFVYCQFIFVPNKHLNILLDLEFNAVVTKTLHYGCSFRSRAVQINYMLSIICSYCIVSRYRTYSNVQLSQSQFRLQDVQASGKLIPNIYRTWELRKQLIGNYLCTYACKFCLSAIIASFVCLLSSSSCFSLSESFFSWISLH